MEGGGGSEAYGEHSGDECECLQHEEIEVTKKDKDGEEYTEYVNCFEATEKDD